MKTPAEQAAFVDAQGAAWAARFNATKENYFSAMNQRARDMEDARRELSRSYQPQNAGAKGMIEIAHAWNAHNAFHTNKPV